jgi:hypothetical protein
MTIIHQPERIRSGGLPDDFSGGKIIGQLQ